MEIALPLSPADFAKNYQEKKPLLMRQVVDADRFSWRDANEIYDRSDVASEDFKLSLDGVRAKSEYVESYLDVGTRRHRLIKPVVYDYLRRGATLTANKIKNEPKVMRFARQIADFTSRQIVSSAYAAFGSKDSFRCHWDTRDVFAIQLIGRKRWIIYPPSLESPWHTQQSRDYEQDYPCPTTPYMDVILEAGDILYVPRGWWHNPLPLDQETFHLALGTFPVYTMDYLSWLMSQMPSCIGARRSLSTWQSDEQALIDVSEDLHTLINNPENYARFMDTFIGATRVDSPLAIEQLGNPTCNELDGITKLRLASSGLVKSSEQYVIANGTKINLDHSGERLLRHITDVPGISVDELVSKCSDMNSHAVRTLLTELCRQDVLELYGY